MTFPMTARLRRECEQGAAMGMDGKTLIHPAQVAIANEVFAPSHGSHCRRPVDSGGIR